MGTFKGYVDQYMWVIRNGQVTWPYQWKTFGRSVTSSGGYLYFSGFVGYGLGTTIAFFIPGASNTICDDWEIQLDGKFRLYSGSLHCVCGSQTMADYINDGVIDAELLEMYWAQNMFGDSTLGKADKTIHFTHSNNYPPKLYWTGWVLLSGSSTGFDDLYVKNLWVNMWMVG